jgi:5-methylcytosine-specific restriction protein B
VTLHEILTEVMEQIRRRHAGSGFDEARYERLVTQDAPQLLRAQVGSDFTVKGSVRMGPLADVPWVSIFPGMKSSAQEGFYLVYLFAKDGSRVYLSLNQGTEELRHATKALRKRALDIRATLGNETDLNIQLDLRSTNQRPKKYEAGSAFAIEYSNPIAQPEETLLAQLPRMVELLRRLSDSGLVFDPKIEPVHLLFKWNTDINPRTIYEHKDIADDRGSVWWGRFAREGGPGVADTKIADLNAQLTAGIPTYAFLHRRGEPWRATVEEITTDRDTVRGDGRLPSYYSADDCNFFARLSNFELLDSAWPTSHLVQASDPDPAKITKALGNQTTPMYVYELFDPNTPKSTPVVITPPGKGGDQIVDREELTMEWLLEESLLPIDLVDEILEALRGRFPQVALAGPPGTGKSHAAELLARYLTQDEPLAYRVVQFHPSYSYEEFIEGLRPVSDRGAISFETTPGKVLQIAKDMGDQPRVLVLDEMNRANLPRVFGELMYLLEKREQSVDLLYSKNFKLPDNLFFIGTMNTADRSIRSIDIALRRRFAIFELPPSPEALERYYDVDGRTNEIDGLVDGFVKLNETLTAALDRHHNIGHTFFMADHYTPELLRTVWRRQLQPLLEEYFFDQLDIAAEYTLEQYWPSAADAD